MYFQDKHTFEKLQKVKATTLLNEYWIERPVWKKQLLLLIRLLDYIQVLQEGFTVLVLQILENIVLVNFIIFLFNFKILALILDFVLFVLSIYEFIFFFL
jgi:hypothetical protein